MDYKDKEIECSFAGCGEIFLWKAGEQKFFADRGFVKPKYCKTHKLVRKAIEDKRGSVKNVERRNQYRDESDRDLLS